MAKVSKILKSGLIGLILRQKNKTLHTTHNMLREKYYKKIVHEVEWAIQNGKYKVGDKLPSINSWRISSGLSRSSVIMAMEELKNRGLIEPEQSVGYFVSSTRVEITHRILLIFNELNGFKETLYNTIINSLGKNTTVDIVFHGFNRGSFDMLIDRNAGKYSVYVVMTGLFEDVESQLRRLGGKVILLDHCNDAIKEAGIFSSVTQYYAQDTYDGLVEALPRLKKYKEIYLVQSGAKEPPERYYGLKLFCQDYNFEHGLLKSMADIPVKTGGVYLTPENKAIVDIMLNADKQGLKVGEDFGLICFNEQRLNEILCGGLTAFSTDFNRMGEILVELIKTKDIRTIRNPHSVIFRNTL